MISEPPINRYNGYNPEFYQRVMKKRREEAARKRLEEAQRERDERERLRLVAKLAEKRAKELSEKFRVIKVRGPVQSKEVAEKKLAEPKQRCTMREAIQDIAAASGISYSELTGPSRNRNITAIRDRAYWEIHCRFPEKSPAEVGRAFGGRDRTTILHGWKKFGYRATCRGTNPLTRMVEPKIVQSMQVAGRTFRQIADHFGVSENTIRRNFHEFQASQQAA